MQQKQLNEFSLIRKFLLGITSIFMSLSVLLAPLAPYPLALVGSLSDRKTQGFIILSLIGLSFCICNFYFKTYETLILFIITSLISLIVSEILRRRVSPLKGIFFGGVIVIGISTLGAFSYLNSKNIELETYVLNSINDNKEAIDKQKDLLLKSTEKEALEQVSLLDQPEVLAKQIVDAIPSYLVVGAFSVIWLNLFLLIRSQRVLFNNRTSALSEFSLVYIKLPDSLIWFVIISLLMALLGDKISPEVTSIGEVLVSALSVFYFFQGFGIFIHFLNYVNMRGFLRTMIIVITVFSASTILIFVGLFDMFINFRKYFVKK